MPPESCRARAMSRQRNASDTEMSTPPCSPGAMLIGPPSSMSCAPCRPKAGIELTRTRRSDAGEEPFNRDAAGKAKWHDQVMRHEGSAAALVFRVSVARDPKQERHLVYRIARAGACLPDPGSEGSAIFSRRYPPFPRRRYCGSATGLGHSSSELSRKTRNIKSPPILSLRNKVNARRALP
jgi:hypothetical protein